MGLEEIHTFTRQENDPSMYHPVLFKVIFMFLMGISLLGNVFYVSRFLEQIQDEIHKFTP